MISMGNDDEFFDLEAEHQLLVQESKAEKKWDKAYKHASNLNKKMNDMSLPYAERDQAEREYSDALDKQNKATSELDKARQDIQILKKEREDILRLMRLLKNEDGEQQFESSIQADNAFWKRPQDIVEKIKSELPFEEVDFKLLRDYPYDECGRKMDLKEYVHTFKHKQLPLECEVNIVTIGNESVGEPCLKTPNSNKINTVVHCKKRVIPKPE